ncbi:MAG: short-chain dehydrogenase [Woeseia sp.]|nr:short-chain dehydrogenase [Woeseia sp.]
MTTVVVTGCNRGIGFELVRQLKARGDEVIGTCRETTDPLNSLGIEVIGNIDVCDDEAAENLSQQLAGRSIDILVNNAGILRQDRLNSIDYESMLDQYRVNTLGPLRITHALLDNLGQGSKVGIITSRVGSIEDNSSGNNYGYRCSKAAANMVGMNLHHDLSALGIAVAILHPGYVKTDMTGGSGMITPLESAQGLIKCLDQLDLESSGQFWHANGEMLPW